jgi:hypothetical protein
LSHPSTKPRGSHSTFLHYFTVSDVNAFVNLDGSASTLKMALISIWDELPKANDAVRIELSISADNRNPLSQCLGNQQSIERVIVVER